MKLYTENVYCYVLCVYSFNHYVLIDANMYKCVTQS